MGGGVLRVVNSTARRGRQRRQNKYKGWTLVKNCNSQSNQQMAADYNFWQPARQVPGSNCMFKSVIVLLALGSFISFFFFFNQSDVDADTPPSDIMYLRLV